MLQVVYEKFVKELFSCWRKRSNMFEVEEEATGQEEIVELRVKRLLALVGLVMDGKSGHDRIKRWVRSDGTEPLRRGEIRLHDALARNVAQFFAGRLKHRIREIDKDTLSKRELFEQETTENAIATAQIEDFGWHWVPKPHDLADDGKLQIFPGDRFAYTFKKGRRQRFGLPSALGFAHALHNYRPLNFPFHSSGGSTLIAGGNVILGKLFGPTRPSFPFAFCSKAARIFSAVMGTSSILTPTAS